MAGPELFFAAGLGAYFAGALAGVAAWRQSAAARVSSFGLATAGSLLIAASAAGMLARGGAFTWTHAAANPLFSWTIRLDALSGWFLLALALLAYSVSIYSIGYLRPLEKSQNLGALGLFYNLLLAGVALVFAAGNIFLFMVAWELMAIAAYCLVAFDHQKQEARRAATVFLVMSHAGGGLLLAAFLLLSVSAGAADFAALHLSAAKLPALMQGWLFVLFLLGFGVKSGMVPLHIWLPEAHPVAPSNVSALMSGIVIKTGIYGMARVFFDFFGPLPLWTGTSVLAIGVISALIGVLYALQDHDLKRLLAHHSIENIGIILMGLGAALTFRTTGHPQLAAIALVASLYHTINHAAFKGLLFLAAGSVVHSTRTRNMEEMGGLIRRMPATAFFFLIGAVAISGLPPLNGFVSEWLTYQALLAGFGVTRDLTRMIFPIAGALLALTAALAAACFVKAFGIPFLALPRSEEAAQAHEAGLAMRLGMGCLAAACVVLGLAATRILPLFDSITQASLGVTVSPSLAGGAMALRAGSPRAGSVSTGGIAILLLIFAGAAILLVRRLRLRTRPVVGPAWDCGLPGLTAGNQYTATAFSKPLRLIFSAFYRPRREIRPEFEVSPYYPSAIRFESGIEPPLETHVYAPLKAFAYSLSRRARAIQAGSIHAYLAYIFVTLIALLLYGVRS